jgi:hypothetical protein
MLRNSCFAPDFDGLDREADLARLTARRAAFSSWRIATALRTIWDAWREGLAAHRQYEQLKSRGIPHDTALRAAIGLRHPAGDVRPAAPRQVSCALTANSHSGETITLCGKDVSSPFDLAPRPGSAGIGNLAYVA